MGTVRDVTKQIEDQVKPTLKNTSEHKGFCIALAAVNDAVGDVEAVLTEGYRPPICPDCHTAMIKKQGTNSAGIDVIAWICECIPVVPEQEGKEPEDVEGGE